MQLPDYTSATLPSTNAESSIGISRAGIMLSEVAKEIGGVLHGDDVRVTGVTHHSGLLASGDIFVAIAGGRADGATFVDAAITAGAVAIAADHIFTDCTVPCIVVANPREAIADIAAFLAGYPSRDLGVIGVTGTDGKTTTSWMVAHLLEVAKMATGLLSTVGYRLPGGDLQPHDFHLTTPESPQIQSTLTRMRDAGAKKVVLESSSHALALDRVRGIKYDIGIWTNLTREHLDFHGSMDEYFAAKRRLIERSESAVLNIDDPWTEQLVGIAPNEVTYSATGNQSADFFAKDVKEDVAGLAFTIVTPTWTAPARLPMPGSFNVDNALAAVAAATLCGATQEQIIEGLASFLGVPGRMQLVPNSRQIRVIVDFAHTPGSIENVLTALSESSSGRLAIVLGAAGGLRDPGRIAPMGAAAGAKADLVILTEDDSYDTDLDFLIGELQRGANGTATVIKDRRDAIAAAIQWAQAGDTVVLAGKGAESVLERPDGAIEWSDVDVASELMS
ncbi:MAG: UDP-N-acetylmuramoyl-L-alanyl-D-glutamate--2,6-diaminopimelate ligase [Propionibacteriaceae bacterium]